MSEKNDRIKEYTDFWQAPPLCPILSELYTQGYGNVMQSTQLLISNGDKRYCPDHMIPSFIPFHFSQNSSVSTKICCHCAWGEMLIFYMNETRKSQLCPLFKGFHLILRRDHQPTDVTGLPSAGAPSGPAYKSMCSHRIAPFLLSETLGWRLPAQLTLLVQSLKSQWVLDKSIIV